MTRVLVLPDLHAPAIKDGFLEFVKSVKRKYRTELEVCAGDVMDQYTWGTYAKDPDHEGGWVEMAAAKIQLAKWVKAFPEVMVCIGNHDTRIQRQATGVGIPPRFLRPLNELLEIPWKFAHFWEIDGVHYTHGDGCGGGLNTAFTLAKSRLQPCVCGHHHTQFGILWTQGHAGVPLWGMQVGTGSNQEHPCLAYSAKQTSRHINGCGVVIDGHPYLELMP